MHALTADRGRKGRHDAVRGHDRSFVLPRVLRRPVRFVRRLALGDVAVPRHAGNLLSVGFVGACALYGSIIGGQFNAGVSSLAVNAGLGISEIEISGNTYTKATDVFAALGLGSGRSLVTLDVAEAQDSLRQLPWVADVTLRKDYPNTLAIDVTERTPYALWQMGEAIAVVEQDGKVIGGFASDPRLAALPLLVGAGASDDGKAIVDVVAAFPEVAKRVHAYIRVGDRRWDLRLSNGVTVKLPELGVEDALTRLVIMDSELDVTGRDIASIDLRQKDRTIFAQTENAASTRAEAVKTRTDELIKKIKGAPI